MEELIPNKFFRFYSTRRFFSTPRQTQCWPEILRIQKLHSKFIAFSAADDRRKRKTRRVFWECFHKYWTRTTSYADSTLSATTLGYLINETLVVETEVSSPRLPLAPGHSLAVAAQPSRSTNQQNTREFRTLLRQLSRQRQQARPAFSSKALGRTAHHPRSTNGSTTLRQAQCAQKRSSGGSRRKKKQKDCARRKPGYERMTSSACLITKAADLELRTHFINLRRA